MDLGLFDSWDGLARAGVRTLAMYSYTVILLRISGKRTTMSMSSFDFIATVAMGTLIGSTMISTSVALAEGMLALTAVVACQWAVSYAISRSSTVQNVMVSPARLLLRHGEIQVRDLRDERISIAQLEQKIRQQGYASTDSIAAVVIESGGQISIVPVGKEGEELIDPERIGSRGLLSSS